MPKFFEQYLKTLSKKRKTELLDWLASNSDSEVRISLFEAIDPIHVLRPLKDE